VVNIRAGETFLLYPVNRVPSLDGLHALTLEKFDKNACNFRLEFAQALLRGKNMSYFRLSVEWEKRWVSGSRCLQNRVEPGRHRHGYRNTPDF